MTNKETAERIVELNQKDFGTLVICAIRYSIRYSHGRQTYIPSTVLGICRHHLRELSDKDLRVMIDDCEFQKNMDLYGDEAIDKPGWIKWEKLLLEEKKRRLEAEE